MFKTYAMLLAVCAAPFAANAADGHNDAHHKTQAAGLEVIHGWVRATTQDSTQLFMDIHNISAAEVTLRGARLATGPGTAVVMGAPIKAGDQPILLTTLPLAPGSMFELDPEGVYLSLTGLTTPLVEGDTLAVVLDLTPIGEVEIVVDVEAPNATQHSHAGHAH